jgi:hypothetical protein
MLQYHAPTGKLVIPQDALRHGSMLMLESLKQIRLLAKLPLEGYAREGGLQGADFAQINILECAKAFGIDLGVAPLDFNKLDLRDKS